MAANAQGKFWQMHDKLFANQQALDRADARQVRARRSGSNMAKYKAAMDAHLYKQQIEDDSKARHRGRRQRHAGVLHQRAVRSSGAQPFDAFKKVIDAELKKAERAGQEGHADGQALRSRARRAAEVAASEVAAQAIHSAIVVAQAIARARTAARIGRRAPARGVLCGGRTRKETPMKPIFALSILSLFFAAAGCGAGPDASSTPETSALAQKLTHEVRMSQDAPGAGSEASAAITSSDGASANFTVIVRCGRRCIMACADDGGTDEFCSASCCKVTTE